MTLDDPTYNYDAACRRLRVSGSLASTGIPQAFASASYNAGNRQTGFASQTLTYDDNGNLTSDGANTVTWNARNQLVAITGPSLSASFQYDALGRRVSKTVNGASTSFLYDGADVVQEQVGGSASANTVLGGLDTALSRSDSSGTVTPLKDGLGSTIALANSSGTIQTQYSYEPFGKTTTSGTASSNPTKYAGREDDATGLYYYRNRYYSPALQRFISEDPIGQTGGINLYAYVANDPVSFRDPFGLHKGDKWYGYNNKDFHKWFHRHWKQPGDPDASREDIEDAFEEWQNQGSPKGGAYSAKKECKARSMPEHDPEYEDLEGYDENYEDNKPFERSAPSTGTQPLTPWGPPGAPYGYWDDGRPVKPEDLPSNQVPMMPINPSLPSFGIRPIVPVRPPIWAL